MNKNVIYIVLYFSYKSVIKYIFCNFFVAYKHFLLIFFPFSIFYLVVENTYLKV
jgi:hypothetical protein